MNYWQRIWTHCELQALRSLRATLAKNGGKVRESKKSAMQFISWKMLMSKTILALLVFLSCWGLGVGTSLLKKLGSSLSNDLNIRELHELVHKLEIQGKERRYTMRPWQEVRSLVNNSSPGIHSNVKTQTNVNSFSREQKLHQLARWGCSQVLFDPEFLHHLKLHRFASFHFHFLKT
jgi:hypothetical protein